MRIWFTLTAFILCAVVVACGCGTSQKSGIYGLAVVVNSNKSTASPSPLPDDFGSTVFGQYPDPHAIILVKSGQADGKIIARVVAGSDGTFKIALPPGEYWLQGKNLPTFFGVPAPVDRGAYSRLIVPAKEL